TGLVVPDLHRSRGVDRVLEIAEMLFQIWSCKCCVPVLEAVMSDVEDRDGRLSQSIEAETAQLLPAIGAFMFTQIRLALNTQSPVASRRRSVGGVAPSSRELATSTSSRANGSPSPIPRTASLAPSGTHVRTHTFELERLVACHVISPSHANPSAAYARFELAHRVREQAVGRGQRRLPARPH